MPFAFEKADEEFGPVGLDNRDACIQILLVNLFSPLNVGGIVIIAVSATEGRP